MIGMKVKLFNRLNTLIDIIEREEKKLIDLYEKSINDKGVNISALEKVIDKIHRYLVSCVNLMEKVEKLRGEVSGTDEVVLRIAYGVLQLDEEGRKKAIDLIVSEIERMKKEKSYHGSGYPY